MSASKKGVTPATTAIFLRLTAAQRKRFRHACVEDDMTYAEFVLDALDRRDRRKQRAGAVGTSPLHAAYVDTAYDDADDWTEA